jgi:isopenicillin N synthase-like dioxygenase
VLFRVFHYPPGDDESWGVGEHTDYGLITLLAQDHHGGLPAWEGVYGDYLTAKVAKVFPELAAALR